MARVLILTASYGSGHNAAARSLATAFHRAGASATVVDHFRDLVFPDRGQRERQELLACNPGEWRSVCHGCPIILRNDREPDTRRNPERS